MSKTSSSTSDHEDRTGRDLAARSSNPRAALVVLVSACALFLVQMVLVFLLTDLADGMPTVLVWATGLLGVVLLVYGGVLVWSLMDRLRRTGGRLAETRSRLQALIDASPLPVLAEDAEGRVTLWNRTAERVFGWSADEAMGGRCPAVPDSELASWEAICGQVLAGAASTELDSQRVTRDGRWLDVTINAAPVRDGSGGIEGVVAVLADVTKHRQTERERQRLEEQLRHAQKMEAVGRLAGGVAHDFNNLLTAIKGHAELLLAEATVPAEMEEDLLEISRSTDRAAALTRQLLTFSRHSLVEPRPLDLNLLIVEMEKLLRRVIGETVQLETTLQEELGLVLADPGQVEQVLMNLVVNARDAMPSGGRIVIRTSDAEISEERAERYTHRVVAGQYVVVSVTDDGMGMDPETAERIFEPFFTTKPVGVGTGLGLSTTYGIIKQARGYIWVESEPGRGTTFSVYLPRVEAERPQDPQHAHRPASAPLARGGETVLIVEDEEPVLSLARKVLERRGYQVLTAIRGHEAVRHAREHPSDIHLLFCDVVMPDLSGREIAERIGTLRPGIRTLMTSGYAEQVVAEQGAVADGMPFLAKPYTPDALARVIRDVLGRD